MTAAAFDFDGKESELNAPFFCLCEMYFKQTVKPPTGWDVEFFL